MQIDNDATWADVDWAALQRLRGIFLDASAGQRDYWQTPRDLASYDRTFAERIGWKWDYVLAELTRRGWLPPPGVAIDWGCGSGIAGRRFVAHFGPAGISALALWDRSTMAMDYAAQRRPGSSRSDGPHRPDRPCRGHAVAEPRLDWSCPGPSLTASWPGRPTRRPSSGSSRGRTRPAGLIAVRRLLGAFQAVAPCTHQAPCGLVAPDNQRHWCHHFAESPPEVHTDGRWARFARLAGVDMRALPVSFLVLDRRAAPAVPPGAVRVIGRPRVYNAYALLFACDAGGVGDRRLMKAPPPRRLPPPQEARPGPAPVSGGSTGTMSSRPTRLPHRHQDLSATPRPDRQPPRGRNNTKRRCAIMALTLPVRVGIIVFVGLAVNEEAVLMLPPNAAGIFQRMQLAS